MAWEDAEVNKQQSTEKTGADVWPNVRVFDTGWIKVYGKVMSQEPSSNTADYNNSSCFS